MAYKSWKQELGKAGFLNVIMLRKMERLELKVHAVRKYDIKRLLEKAESQGPVSIQRKDRKCFRGKCVCVCVSVYPESESTGSDPTGACYPVGTSAT